MTRNSGLRGLPPAISTSPLGAAAHASHPAMSWLIRPLALFHRTGDHGPALRVGLGLALPGLLLLLLGRTDLMIYAVFGSVTGMYGRSPQRARRLRDQLLAGGMMLCAGLGGIVAAPWVLRSWTLVAAGMLVAAAGSVVADRCRLHPAGAFFPLFAFGALATLPVGGTLALSGLAAFAVAVLVSVALGQLSRFPPQPVPVLPPAPVPGWSRTLSRAASYVLVLLLSGTAGILLGFDNLQWVLAGSVVPLAAGNASGRLRRGIHRVTGTIIGLGVLLILYSLQLPEPVLGLAVILLMFPTEAYMTRNYGLALSFFTPLIMLMIELAEPSAGPHVIWERAAGNVLGVAAGLVGALFFDSRRR